MGGRGSEVSIQTVPRVPSLGVMLGVCALLVLAVALVFGQTAGHGFIDCDDHLYVYENPEVSGGLTFHGIAWAFTERHASNWHPLTWISHMLDCQLFGLKAGGHHLTSEALHAAVAVLLFLALLRMTSRIWPSAFAAALFAIHPLRVESVAWVAERKNVLSGLFFMLTLLAYVRYTRRDFSWLRYLGVFVPFLLGLLCKAMLVTLPFVLLLLDYWPLQRFDLAAMKSVGAETAMTQSRFRIAMWLLIEKLPMIALSAVFCAVTMWRQNASLQSTETYSFGLRITNTLVSYTGYLQHTFYPVGLAAFYPYPAHLPAWKIVASLFVLLAVSTVAILFGPKHRYLLVGWLWYLGMLVPVIGLIQVGEQAMADRYTYLTQIGLYILLAWAVADFFYRPGWRQWLCYVGSALVLAILMLCFPADVLLA